MNNWDDVIIFLFSCKFSRKDGKMQGNGNFKFFHGSWGISDPSRLIPDCFRGKFRETRY